MNFIWDELTLNKSTELKACKKYIIFREEQQLVQFFMTFHNDFEGPKDSILHHALFFLVASMVNELVVEETH